MENAVFDVLGPDGDELARESIAASFSLPSDGAHAIIVDGTRGNASSELNVEIPAR